MKNINEIGAACFGCHACEQLCPTHAIALKPNKEGFLYPHVNSACIDCGLCLNRCPANPANDVETKGKQSFFGFSANDSFILDSASGGFATYLSKKILQSGGIVCGCALVDNKAQHIFVESEEELIKLQSSKYVQSNLSGCYQEIKRQLLNDRYVLFIGTSCQVFGLNTYLNKSYEKLLTVDLICHGVPSPELFANYIHYLEKKEKSAITDYNFRYKKKNGWGTYYYYYCRDTKKARAGNLGYDKYGYDFLHGLNYRECCYNCRFTDLSRRPGDFTIGDFWGIKDTNPAQFNKDGVSCVIINSPKGEEFINSLDENLLFGVAREDVILGQTNLLHPTPRPEKRDSYYNNFSRDFFFKRKLPIKQQIKKLVPSNVKKFIKKILKSDEET